MSLEISVSRGNEAIGTYSVREINAALRAGRLRVDDGCHVPHCCIVKPGGVPRRRPTCTLPHLFGSWVAGEV